MAVESRRPPSARALRERAAVLLAGARARSIDHWRVVGPGADARLPGRVSRGRAVGSKGPGNLPEPGRPDGRAGPGAGPARRHQASPGALRRRPATRRAIG